MIVLILLSLKHVKGFERKEKLNSITPSIDFSIHSERKSKVMTKKSKACPLCHHEVSEEIQCAKCGEVITSRDNIHSYLTVGGVIDYHHDCDSAFKHIRLITSSDVVTYH